jgi:hypothetical protein
MIKLQSLINELRVVRLDKNESDSQKYFLAYKDKLFVLDDQSKIGSLNSRMKKHVKGHPGIDPERKRSSWGPLGVDDVHEFLNRMSEIAPDVVVGEYYPEARSAVVWSGSEIQPRTSLTVKKLAKELGLDKVVYRHRDEPNYDDDKEIEYPTNKLVGGMPDVMFHGTNSHALGDIIRFGLDASRGSSKFASRGIHHPEHVFFTAVFQEAIYYAFNAKREDKKKWNNYPIIVEFTIPDKALIHPDYDADISTTSNRYFPKFQSQLKRASDMKSTGITRETGKWSYKGRIPASFIRWIYYYKPFEHKWYKSKPETWAKLLSKYEWETLGYKLGLNSEEDL